MFFRLALTWFAVSSIMPFSVRRNVATPRRMFRWILEYFQLLPKSIADCSLRFASLPACCPASLVAVHRSRAVNCRVLPVALQSNPGRNLAAVRNPIGLEIQNPTAVARKHQQIPVRCLQDCVVVPNGLRPMPLWRTIIATLKNGIVTTGSRS